MQAITIGHVMTALVWLGIAGIVVGVLRAWLKRRREQRLAPREVVPAIVTALEKSVTTLRTSHYISKEYHETFQLQDGRRLRLSIPETEYSCLHEGDEGQLTFQGNRYLWFGRS